MDIWGRGPSIQHVSHPGQRQYLCSKEYAAITINHYAYLCAKITVLGRDLNEEVSGHAVSPGYVPKIALKSSELNI